MNVGNWAVEWHPSAPGMIRWWTLDKSSPIFNRVGSVVIRCEVQVSARCVENQEVTIKQVVHMPGADEATVYVLTSHGIYSYTPPNQVPIPLVEPGPGYDSFLADKFERMTKRD